MYKIILIICIIHTFLWRKRPRGGISIGSLPKGLGIKEMIPSWVKTRTKGEHTKDFLQCR